LHQAGYRMVTHIVFTVLEHQGAGLGAAFSLVGVSGLTAPTLSIPVAAGRNRLGRD
jgi:hypothetical protein